MVKGERPKLPGATQLALGTFLPSSHPCSSGLAPSAKGACECKAGYTLHRQGCIRAVPRTVSPWDPLKSFIDLVRRCQRMPISEVNNRDRDVRSATHPSREVFFPLLTTKVYR